MDRTVPQLLNEQETAKILAVSIAALRRWRRERRGPSFVRCERCVRYALDELSRFVALNSSSKEPDNTQSKAVRRMRNANACNKG
jgi:subtilase family serine protease